MKLHPIHWRAIIIASIAPSIMSMYPTISSFSMDSNYFYHISAIPLVGVVTDEARIVWNK